MVLLPGGRVRLLMQEGKGPAGGGGRTDSRSIKKLEPAPRAGLVSFHSDGLETVFRPDLVDTYNWKNQLFGGEPDDLS